MIKAWEEGGQRRPSGYGTCRTTMRTKGLLDDPQKPSKSWVGLVAALDSSTPEAKKKDLLGKLDAWAT